MSKKDKNEPFSRSKMKYADKIKYGQCEKWPIHPNLFSK